MKSRLQAAFFLRGETMAYHCPVCGSLVNGDPDDWDNNCLTCGARSEQRDRQRGHTAILLFCLVGVIFGLVIHHPITWIVSLIYATLAAVLLLRSRRTFPN